MRDPYSAAAQGLETGFGLGLKADELAESRRRNAFQEGRQTLADQRADEDLKLRQKREAATEDRNARLDTLKGLGMVRTGLGQRKTELATAAGAAKAESGEIPQGIADEFSEVSGQAAQIDQQMRNLVSKLTDNQIGLEDISPADRHQMILSTTGFAPEEAPRVIRAIDDFNAGMSDQNWGLVTQSMNTLLRPKLMRSWGAPSAHGGNIDHTEVIGLDPAPNNPNMVIPRLRVYTTLTDENGQNLYYDAPMTKNGTADPEDPVQTIDVKRGMDWLGNLGITMQAVQNPQVAGLFAEGAAANKDRAERYRAELNGLALKYQPKVGATQERVNAVKRYMRDTGITSVKEATAEMHRLGLFGNTGVAAATLEAKLAEVDNQVANGDLSDEEGAALKRQIVSGQKPVSDLDRERVKTEQARQGLFSARMNSILSGGTGRAGGKAGGGAGGLEPTLNDESLRFMAEQYLAGDKSVFTNLGRGAQGSANVTALRRAITNVAAEKGMSPRDTALAVQEFMGLGAAQRALGTRAASFGMAKAEADEMADLVTQSSEAYGRTQFMPVNKALNAFETNTGDTKIREFGAAINSFINAYARAISPTGTVTVNDKEHAREMLSTADSHQQVVAIIGQLKKEMAAAGKAPGVVKEQLRSGFREPPAGNAPAAAPAPAPRPAGGAPARIQSDAEYNALPSGATFIAPDGSTRRKP